MSIIDHLTTLFAPDDCLACGREGTLLCAACQTQLPRLPGQCFGCHQAIKAGVGCADCCQTGGCTTMQAVTAYQGAAKQLVAHLKFHGNQSAAKIMAQAMLLAAGPLPAGVLLTHVPATTQHIRQRGYDQAELITRHLARTARLPRAPLLRRTGQKHQLGADRSQRLAQLQDSIRLKHTARIQNAHILLIDDVLTTGSSLRAAATILRAAGAVRVDALVFAQA